MWSNQGLGLCCMLLLSLWLRTKAVPITLDGILNPPTEEALHTLPEDEDTELHYDRYLREVFSFLKKDEHFLEMLKDTDTDGLKPGALNSVSHQVRTKLDELKRQEMNRLGLLIKAKQSVEGGRDMAVAHQALKQFRHLNPTNPHFEVEDLDQLFKSAVHDLENYDKEYHEMYKMKEHEQQEFLKTLEETEKEELHYRETNWHTDQPYVNHLSSVLEAASDLVQGSQDQLKEVWVESDGLDLKDIDPKTFFHLYDQILSYPEMGAVDVLMDLSDTNGDGYLNELELEALFTKELAKIYRLSNVMDLEREKLRMREHLMKEADANNDQLLSLMEFIAASKKEIVAQDTWEEEYHVDELEMENLPEGTGGVEYPSPTPLEYDCAVSPD